MLNIHSDKYYFKIPKYIFILYNSFYFSNTIAKIYNGFDNIEYILKRNAKNLKTFISNSEKTNNHFKIILPQYKYSLVDINHSKINSFHFMNIFNNIKNYIYRKYDQSDTKIIVNDLSTSFNNMKYNFKFLLGLEGLPNIYEFLSMNIFSSTSFAVSLLNKDYLSKDCHLKNIPELEYEICYFYKLMLKNNFFDKNKENKIFCSESTLLLLNSLYGKTKKYPIMVKFPSLIRAKCNGKEIKTIQFKINVTEFNLNTNKIEENTYLLEIKKNENKNCLEKYGHNFCITNIQLLESKNMLI